jgi:hypothetical protein
MASKLDGPGLAAVSVGIVFAYAGVKGYSPLKAFTNIVNGKHPNEGQNAMSLTNPAAPSSTFGGGTFSGGGTPSKNQALAKQIAISMGHSDWTTGKIWSDWVSLWDGESGWNEKAYNSGSGATGIPQALPGNKMASAGADWKTNPATQIKWGIGYIADRYGNPSNAYSQWLSRSPHWY